MNSLSSEALLKEIAKEAFDSNTDYQNYNQVFVNELFLLEGSSLEIKMVVGDVFTVPIHQTGKVIVRTFWPGAKTARLEIAIGAKRFMFFARRQKLFVGFDG